MWLRITREEAEALTRCITGPTALVIPQEDRALISSITRRWDEARTLSLANTNALHVARRKYAYPSSDNIEIDLDCPMSESDDGVWIGAWVYLTNEEKDS